MQPASGSYKKDSMILNLCREANPSADMLLQLLHDASTSAGVNYEDEKSKTPLIEATARGHICLLPVLIAAGSELDHFAVTTSPKGLKQHYTALHAAIVTGQLDAVKLLVQAGASLHVTDHKDRSPWSLALTEAAHFDNDYIYQEHSLSAALHASILPSISAYMRSLAELLEICKSSAPSLEAAEACLRDTSELSSMRLKFVSAKGLTALHEACSRGHFDIVRLLLQQKADVNAASFMPNNVQVQGHLDLKETPLHLAAANGHSRVAALLLQAGADIAVLTAKGLSALHVAVVGLDGRQHVDVVRVIVEELISSNKVRSNRVRVSSIINCPDAFECSALHAAAREGSVPIIQLLLSVKGVNVNMTDIRGQTALHLASTHGHSLIVSLIAKCRECEVNKRLQANQDSCVHVAARRGHVDVLIALGAAGAHLVNEVKDAAGKIKSVQLISNKSLQLSTPLDVVQGDEARDFLEKAFDVFLLCTAAPGRSGSIGGGGGGGIKSILSDPRTRVSFLSFRTNANNTPLHVAVMSQNIEAITDILGCYGQTVEDHSSLCYGYGLDCQVTNGDGLSPVDLMSESSSVKMKEILTSLRFNMDLFRIILREDVTCAEVVHEISRNPVSLAFKYRSSIGLAAAGSGMSLCDGDTCLHVAAGRGLEHIVRQLIDVGCDVNAKNCKGQTPLYVAMSRSDASITSSVDGNNFDECLARITALLIDAGANVDDKDEDLKYIGETALFRAARSCRHECIKVLLSAGADVNVVSNDGDTIFHVYRKNAHLTIQLINACGVRDINLANIVEGNTALHAVVKRSVTGQSVTLLLDSRADPMICNNEGHMPLHVACRYGRVRSIARLLEHGVDINAPTRASSKTSAENRLSDRRMKNMKQRVTADWEQLHVLNLQLESAFSHIESSSHLDTPLHSSCRHGMPESVRALLQHKTHPDTLARNSNGRLPLEVSRNLDAPTTRLLLEAMSRQSSEIERIVLCSTGGRDCPQFEDNLSFMFSKFPKLQQIIIDNCEGLRSLPPSVKKLTCLKIIQLLNCSNLRSLPDEMGSMQQLQSIKVDNCPALEFPPKTICEGSNSTKKIQTYLKESSGATPLRSVKVLLLGNGRSGKTSLVRLLAKMPLQPGDAGPESTRGVSVNTLADKLQPGFIQTKFHDVPQLMFWDFAGQLEYSAAHEYFMSNSQAVYVIVFSVMEERDCMLQQVKYWLNTVSLRCSRFNRLLLVGTKIDLILGSHDELLARCRADMLGLVRRCFSNEVRVTDKDVMFVSSLSTYPGMKEMRRAIKDRLYDSCKDIFNGDAEYLRNLRFPEQYKQMLLTVNHLAHVFPDRPPIYHTWDTQDRGLGVKDIAGVKELKALDGTLSQQKEDALSVLHNIGHILLAQCDQGLCVCFRPQFIANIIAIFADPSCVAFEGGVLRACASQDSIMKLLQQNLEAKYRSFAHLSAIFNFLLRIGIIIEIDISDTSRVDMSDPALHQHLFMVPSALKGRPSFWREILPQPVACLRGQRYRSVPKIVTVGLFLRTMSGMVQNPDRMWGCAFLIEVSSESAPIADSASELFKEKSQSSSWIFIRLNETRNFVDAIILGANIDAINSPEASVAVNRVMKNLECDVSSPSTLCPYCCASDVYVRCGAAHKFFTDKHLSSDAAAAHYDDHREAASPSDAHGPDAPSASSLVLNCSRFHSVSINTMCLGLVLVNLGRSDMPPLYPAAGRPLLQSPAAQAPVSASSASESSSVPSLSRVRDRLPWQRLTCTGLLVLPDQSGRVLCHSFFVLTLQLAVDDVVSRTSMDGLHSRIAHAAAAANSDGDDDDGTITNHVYEAIVLKSSSTAAMSESISSDVTVTVPLTLSYRVGDTIGQKTIARIYSCSRANAVQLTTTPPASSSSSTTAFTLEQPHMLSEGDAVMLCVNKDYDGGRCDGIACEVARIVDERSIELARVEPLPKCFSQQLPVVNGAVLLPQIARFGPLDRVLVVYKSEKGHSRPAFSIFAGNSECLQVLPLTHERCSTHQDEAACWREVEDNWSTMLGNESKHYEITAVTLFRNVEREELFLQEVEALSCVARDTAVYDGGAGVKSEDAHMKRQVMGHFKEFSQKFSLLPPSENKDVNLCVAWWGKSPAAYHATALNGFWNLPQHLKLDPGYFGEGFYLTRYPRYSDYYLNGLSMSKRVIERGDILMCYTALGRAYPVTESPFAPSNLCGKPCAPDSACHNQGGNSHDSHYVTVKLNPETKQFLPCPHRQVPDFDEIVLFNAKRILPAAYVSFKRRRKTLLWLACGEDLQEVKRILERMNVLKEELRQSVGTSVSFLQQGVDTKLEDQVDVTLFTSASAFAHFMLANTHFKDYPSTLFRIVCAQQQYKQPGSLFHILHSHPTWAAAAPHFLIFAPSAQARAQGDVNVRIATDEAECFEFASFGEL